MGSSPFVDKTGELGEKDLTPSTSTTGFMSGKDVTVELNASIASEKVQAKQKVEPKVWKGTTQKQADAIKAVSQEQAAEAENRTNEQRIAELELILSALKSEQGVGGVKVVTANPKSKLDFTKLSEKDVFDLNIPIEAIDHHVPDLTRIVLRDQNYIARYINIHPGRIGPMRAAGFTFITEDDIESIAMDIKPDENGQYRYIDTVAMKCPKIKYLGALRANFLRAKAVTDKNVIHKIMKTKTAEMLGSRDMAETNKDSPDFGKGFKQDAQKYQSEGKMEVYI